MAIQFIFLFFHVFSYLLLVSFFGIPVLSIIIIFFIIVIFLHILLFVFLSPSILSLIRLWFNYYSQKIRSSEPVSADNDGGDRCFQAYGLWALPGLSFIIAVIPDLSFELFYLINTYFLFFFFLTLSSFSLSSL